MKFIFPQNYDFKSKLFGLFDYSTIILNLVCWKFKLIKYVPYTLVIAIVFLFASIFKVSYL